MKTRSRLRLFLFLGVLCTFLGSSTKLWAQDGIYADFQTSMGDFSCKLEYTIAPKAVANFIGLATGQRTWLNLTNGLALTNAFYDGLTFHRVITNFVIQGGSPNGTGSDGPGYAFIDEFSTSLRFSTPWMLAMANSGPDSNGSQFFITVAPTTSLNNVHTIFGRVVSGTNIVYAINQVQTDSNNKPLTNVVIQHVTIRRVGTSAQAFKIDSQALPVVAQLPMNLVVGTNRVVVTFTNHQFADNRLFRSTNLAHWSDTSLGIEIAAQITNRFYITGDTNREFFRLSQIQYAGSTLAPKSVNGKTLTMNLGADGTLKLVFNSSGGGTYTFGTSTGTISSYGWIQEPYRGWLYPIYYSSLVPMQIRFDFTSATGGKLSGTAYATVPFAISGSFTLSP